MADKIVNYLKSPAGSGKRLVAITGGWHVSYGFGVPKKVVRRMPLCYTIVLPQEISIPEERQAELTMAVKLPELPLYLADFVWMVPYEDLEGKRVRLGVAMVEGANLVTVQDVEDGSPAAKAGVLKGDEVVSFDGQAIKDMGDLKVLVNNKVEGDQGILVVRRYGAEVRLDITFFKITEKKTPNK